MSEEEWWWERCWDIFIPENNFLNKKKKELIVFNIIKNIFSILEEVDIKGRDISIKEFIENFIIIDIDNDFECYYKEIEEEIIYKYQLSELWEHKIEFLRKVLVLDLIKKQNFFEKIIKEEIKKEKDINELEEKLNEYIKNEKLESDFKEKYWKIEDYPTETIIIKKSEIEKKQKIWEISKKTVTWVKKKVVWVLASIILLLHITKF